MKKSVKSVNPCLAGRQAWQSVIQTSYDIVKAHGGEITVESKSGEGLPAGQTGSEFIISIPFNNSKS